MDNIEQHRVEVFKNINMVTKKKVFPWKEGPAQPTLSPNDLHLWTLDTQSLDPSLESLYTLLNEEEKQRAHRFVFERHYRRFVIARGVLRQLLGAYLGCNPKNLRRATKINPKNQLLSEIF